MKLLLIDTSNQPLSVALTDGNDVLAEITNNSKTNHSVQLMPMIERLFNESNMSKNDLDGIVVAEGPGSYTGLRIGVTTAKTLAYALNCKLYGVSSLKALAATISENNKLLVPIFDARREAVYAGIYQQKNGLLETVLDDQYISINDLKQKLHELNQPYVYIGEDTVKLAHLIDAEGINQLPQASVMSNLITEPTEIHSFVPKYHKITEAERNWIDQQKNN
ncbi:MULTISPECIES: tRNA (adenosine(37)-N6)-threonylcarbamoyltransferase complex dimerization subunit type 1 TsaB [Staphylococcus]|uniref:tRNA (adenosine(37)-N6)-threonylcarbamoyltransferase complex dimerization subunit type 1 TsaB n=1 Tax=Staphylococcus TaxID=1279 RepID=UPI0002463AD8|nr:MULTISPECIES: tRNA (adenosine(37)-N6)-threonylcarbamoyltransferase complex dimerization subunit type 1 TsaB [Staphylococcus]QAV32228.1 tRNA (adenosine(37)-N6)-threonylcarbamoyltransferase complex dimerization subunit type 1 TsaB [Sulfitobacter donghicola]AGZ24805.1 universal bacterial protein YeaZ [Staphylococcus pasteuri SP1]KAB7644034.1 tRNA (adenosine(37)-N6)-threonylcarbamoyltransferase complex dimerization subunit type 1 TsaB [Staphylococcus sp. B2-b]MBN6853775.1 tRNA (adenosine(37)-N6)